jgi:hypothetical protein
MANRQIVFLTYISRSGSTLLARMLDEYQDIGVTIEAVLPDGIKGGPVFDVSCSEEQFHRCVASCRRIRCRNYRNYDAGSANGIMGLQFCPAWENRTIFPRYCRRNYLPVGSSYTGARTISRFRTCPSLLLSSGLTTSEKRARPSALGVFLRKATFGRVSCCRFVVL